MIRLPDRPHRLLDGCTLLIAARSTGKQIPDAAAKICPRQHSVGDDAAKRNGGNDDLRRHAAPPASPVSVASLAGLPARASVRQAYSQAAARSEEHTSELQSRR